MWGNRWESGVHGTTEEIITMYRDDLKTNEKRLAALPAFKEQIQAGKRLYEKIGCKACHQIGSDGGSVGPILTNVGSRLTEGYIYKQLENPQALIPDIVEPNYGFTEEERINLTRYLMSLK